MTGGANEAFLADVETQLVIYRFTAPGPVARTRASFVRLVISFRARSEKCDISEQTEGSHT